jgi:hypothetical protein
MFNTRSTLSVLLSRAAGNRRKQSTHSLVLVDSPGRATQAEAGCPTMGRATAGQHDEALFLAGPYWRRPLSRPVHAAACELGSGSTLAGFFSRNALATRARCARASRESIRSRAAVANLHFALSGSGHKDLLVILGRAMQTLDRVTRYNYKGVQASYNRILGDAPRGSGSFNQKDCVSHPNDSHPKS